MQPPQGMPDLDTVPLTEAQAGLWYAQRLDPLNPVFNTGQAVDLIGPLDLEAFQQAVDGVLSEADGLAVRIVEGADGPVQQVDEGARAALCVVDLSAEPDPLGAARAWMLRDLNQPVDLSTDAPVAEVLFVLGAEHHLWYQRIHHVVIDGYGTALLTKRIADCYRDRLSDQEPGAGFRPLADLLEADRAYLTSDKREVDRRFWMAELADLPPVSGLAHGAATTARYYHRHALECPEGTGAALRALAEAARVPWPDVLVGLVAAYVARHTDAQETVVGVATMNRLGTPAATIPAMVMNILPLRVAIDEDQRVAGFSASISARLRRARTHGRYRSEQLRRDLGLLGGARRLYGPLINVLPFDETPAFPGITARLETLATGPVDDLTINLRADAKADGLRLELDGNPTLYQPADLARHADRLAAFLDAALTADTLAQVPTLTAEEHRRWVDGVNRTDHPVPDSTLAALIEETMSASPEATAVEGDGQILDYQALDRRTRTVAGQLAELGVRRGDIVAVAMPRSVDLVVALVAIVRMGAAYLPLDPDHPPGRLLRMLELARPTALVAVSGVEVAWPAGLPVLQLDQPAQLAEPWAGEGPAPDDAAYVIFTSGSTGDPKGVVVEHRAIVNRLEWMRTHYGVSSQDRFLLKTPATFDVSVWEFFLPLICGAALVVAPPDAHRDPAWLASLIRATGITMVHFVPSMLAVFLAEPSARGVPLRKVFVSGEALSEGLRDRCHAVLDAELHNLYGPTEAAVDVSFWNASRGDASAPVPIGFPVWNTRLYVLDSRMRPVPPGVPGELYIGGVQLARGYLGRPDLTAERFVADPFGAPGQRLYRTGDIATQRDDGAILYLGRTDFQVKIRGQRIELGEVEAALLAQPGVAQSVVIVREDSPGDQRLIGYLIGDGATIDVAAVRSALQETLPEQMVPSVLIELMRWPLTPSGKLDRRALPVPERRIITPDERPLRTLTERRLATLFAEVLGADVASPEADFFELGGHSLTGARLMRLVRETWNCEIGLGALFAQSRVAGLAARIDQTVAGGVGGEGLDRILQLSRSASLGRPPVFCIHPAGGISWCYGGLARSLGAERLIYGVQAVGLDLGAPLPDRLEEMAAEYVERIRSVAGDGPYHLVGWSVGGIMAQAMAVRLQELGEQVGVLALLDAYPADRWHGMAEPDAAAPLRALLLIAGYDPDQQSGLELTRERVIEFLRAGGSPLGGLTERGLSGVVRSVEHNNRLVRSHAHRRFNGPALHFHATLEHAQGGASPAEWDPYVNGIERHDLPVRHAHMVGPEAVALMVPVLRRALDRAESMVGAEQGKGSADA
ncbi:MAG: amino acid adenylation domain-containing protein [Gemmatimonadales bacterium]